MFKAEISKCGNNQTGFTLVEVLASVVLISIVLIGVFNLMIFTNKTATSNNEHLVAINLGKATIERMKLDYGSFIEKPSSKPDYVFDRNGKETYDLHKCQALFEDKQCKMLYKPKINNKDYNIVIDVSQNHEEKRLKLINVVVTVKDIDNKMNHKVEGYVNYGYAK